MPNELLIFAETIRKTAKELMNEKEDDPILIDKDEERKVNKELQEYSTFLRKFLAVKGNDEILSKLSPLFENPRLRKPRNAILLMLEKSEQKSNVKPIAELIMDLRRILLRYGNLVERYPAIKLLKEVLNYGVVNGVPAFKRLLTIDRKLYNTFGAQGKLEKERSKNQKM
jgi:hypothetical protein